MILLETYEIHCLGSTSQQSSGITLVIIQVVSVLTLDFTIRPDSQYLFVLVDLRQLQREIGDAQCRHAGLSSIHRFLGSLTRMGVMDAQAALERVRLCICDFPTNTRPDTGVGGVPSWNTYADNLAEAAFTMAYEFMVAGEVVIALCMPKQYIPRI
ncbi:hypothetical protein L7F22_033720 [Adiantum nelumboides]|nr:hypothetical protein [Adiantum nelumboides]